MTPLAITDHRFQISPVGIEFRADLDFDTWNTLGEKLVPVGRAIGFIIGDWINYGNGRYGQMYEEALAKTGLTYQTLANYAYVARRVQFSCRQENLGFEHHAVVAKLKSPDDQKHWLEMAGTHDLSVRRLRKSINYGRLATEEEMTEGPTERGHETYLVYINQLLRWWKRETGKAPVDTWDKERRDGLRRHFSRIAEIHKAL
jgi:hypothetical protein